MGSGADFRAPYVTATTLLIWAVQNWATIDGFLMVEAGGINLETEHLPRALNILYHLINMNKDEKERTKLRRTLQPEAKDSWRIDYKKRRTMGHDPDAPVSAEQHRKQQELMAFLGQMGQV